MPSWLRHIPKVESYSSFVQQLWLLAKWLGFPTLLALVMAWLARISDILSAYAPFSWAAIALAVVFIGVLIMTFHAVWQEKRSRTSLNIAFASERKAINPLDATFDKVRIRALDFFTPFGLPYKNKNFTHCEFIGPATIAFNGGTFVRRVVEPIFIDCEFVRIKSEIRLKSGIIFENCTFADCKFYTCTILIAGHAEAMPNIPKEAFLNPDEDFARPSP